jgi:uncharacterized phage protein gp47/JayE
MANDPKAILKSLLNEFSLRGLDASPGSELAYLGRSLSGLFYSLSLQTDYLLDQLFPSSADEKYLLRHAAIRGITRIPGSKARGEVTVSSGSLPIGTRLLGGNRSEYEVTASVGSQSTVQSLELGEAQNLAPGEALRLLSPIGLVREATISPGGVNGGSDPEPIEDLRQRVLTAWRQPAESGRIADYFTWLGQRKELSKAFLFPGYPLPGVVSWAGLVATGELSWDLPNAAIQREITAYLDARRPPAARVEYLKEAKIVPLTITILGTITAANQLGVSKSLRQQIFNRATIKGAFPSNVGADISESVIRNIISQQLGSIEYELTLAPLEKIGPDRLEFGEIALVREVRFG